jgi:hypothetical protein
MWDVRELGAKVTVSSATFDVQSSNGFLVSISLENIGTRTLVSGKITLRCLALTLPATHNVEIIL